MKTILQNGAHMIMRDNRDEHRYNNLINDEDNELDPHKGPFIFLG